MEPWDTAATGRVVPMSDTDSPAYEWEVSPDSRAAYLFRLTDTTKKTVFAVVENGHIRQFGGDPEWAPDGKDMDPPERPRGRGLFFAAIAAAFVRGPSPWEPDELRSARDPLTWYEGRALDLLTERRRPNGYREPDTDVCSPGLSPESWKLIKHARSRITLSDYLGGDRNAEQAREMNTGLDEFGPGPGP